MCLCYMAVLTSITSLKIFFLLFRKAILFHILYSLSEPVSAQALMSQNYDVASNTSVQLNDIQGKFDPVAEQTSTIRIIFYVMIGWIVLVTVVLIAVAAATYKHWRRDRSLSLLDTSSVRSRSESRAGSLEDFDNEGKKVVPGGNANSGFSGEAEVPPPPPGQMFTKSVALVHSTIAQRQKSGLTSLTSLDETSSVFHAPLRPE